MTYSQRQTNTRYLAVYELSVYNYLERSSSRILRWSVLVASLLPRTSLKITRYFHKIDISTPVLTKANCWFLSPSTRTSNVYDWRVILLCLGKPKWQILLILDSNRHQLDFWRERFGVSQETLKVFFVTGKRKHSLLRWVCARARVYIRSNMSCLSDSCELDEAYFILYYKAWVSRELSPIKTESGKYDII